MGGQGSVSKMIQNLKEIVNCYDSEIYTMLVECNMDPNKAVIRLISQDPFQEVKSKRNRKMNTKDLAESSSRRFPNRGARNSVKDSYNTARGGGNKFNHNETRIAQSVPTNRRGNHWAGSSSASGVISDPKNAEVKKAAPTGSTGAATSSSLPAPAYQSPWVNANPGKKTMAEIVKMGKPLHQKKVFVPRSSETQKCGSKAPLKDEGSSTQKQDVSEPVSSILKPTAESKTHANYQVSKPQHVDESRSSETQESGSKAPLKDEGSSVEKQDVSEPVSSILKPAAEPKTHADQVNEPQHVDDAVPETKKNPVVQCSHLRFGTFGLGIGSSQATSSFNDNLEDRQEEQQQPQQLRNNATDEQEYYHIDLTDGNDSERAAAQHEPPQEDPQMHNLESFFTNVMGLRGAGQQAAAPNQQTAALNRQRGMPLRHHGNFTVYPYVPHDNYMHSGFQQGFPFGNHQSPLDGVLSPSASSFQQQNETSILWNHLNRPYLHAAPGGGAYKFSAHTSQPPPSFVQAQQLYQQQAAMLLQDQLHHNHYHQHHHQQSGGEAFSRIREQLWSNNN